MQKLSAILLLLSFAFSQYARQVSYWECSISNLFSSSGQCDCEKILETANNGDKDSAVVHFHVHPDDLFTLHRFSFEIPVITIAADLINGFNSYPLLHGFHAPPWQPPNS